YGDLDVGKLVSDWRKLDLVRLWNDEAVQDFVKPAMEMGQSNLAQANAIVAMLQAYGVPDTIRGKASIVVFGVGTVTNNTDYRWFDVAHPPASIADLGSNPGPVTSMNADGKTTISSQLPDLVLCVETSGKDAFDAAFGRALELVPQSKTAEVQIDGVAMKETRIPIQVALGFDLVTYRAF